MNGGGEGGRGGGGKPVRGAIKASAEPQISWAGGRVRAPGRRPAGPLMPSRWWSLCSSQHQRLSSLEFSEAFPPSLTDIGICYLARPPQLPRDCGRKQQTRLLPSVSRRNRIVFAFQRQLFRVWLQTSRTQMTFKVSRNILSSFYLLGVVMSCYQILCEQ